MAFIETRTFPQAKNPGVILCPIFHPHRDGLESSFKAPAQDLGTSTRLSPLKPSPPMAPKAHVVWLLPPFFLPHPLLSFLCFLRPHWSSCCASHMTATCPLRTYPLAISSLPSGLCSNTVSSERTPSATPYKDFPLNPDTLYPFFFFFLITLITTI